MNDDPPLSENDLGIIHSVVAGRLRISAREGRELLYATRGGLQYLSIEEFLAYQRAVSALAILERLLSL
jgi:hypothetical protein